jgi:poly(A) polymerase Pap1
MAGRDAQLGTSDADRRSALHLIHVTAEPGQRSLAAAARSGSLWANRTAAAAQVSGDGSRLGYAVDVLHTVLVARICRRLHLLVAV